MPASFAIRNLQSLSVAQSFTEWVYRHDGLIDDVFGHDFFQDASSMFTNGDVIFIVTHDRTQLVYVHKSYFGMDTRIEIRGLR